MRHQQRGFTLIEIAIVLVIIGLLLGGVLKGQELINSAKVKNLAQDFRGVSAAYYGYQDRFRASPGDDRAANTHVNGGTTATTGGVAGAARGDARVNGSFASVTNTDETFLVWQHLRLAGLITGTPDTASGDYIPRNAEGGIIGLTGDPVLTNPATPYPGIFYVCSRGIQGRYARQLDTQLDDGNTQTGSIRVIENNVATQADATAVLPADDATQYAVCMSF